MNFIFTKNRRTGKYALAFCLCFYFLSSSIVGYAQCNDVTVSGVATPSTCQANGTIQVTLSGADAANILMSGTDGVQYALKNVSSNTYTLEFTHVESGLLTGIAPGTYNLEVRGFCRQNNSWAIYNGDSPVVVEGNYRVPTVGTPTARKSLNCTPTGYISMSIADGSKPYTIEITGKPNTYTGQTTFTDIDRSPFTLNNLPPGTYTLKTTDVCNYEIDRTVTIGVVSEDIPVASIITKLEAYRGRTANDCRSVGIERVLPNSSTSDEYYYYVSHANEYYEVGFVENNASATPTTWIPLSNNSEISCTLTQNFKDMFGKNLYVYVRVKNCPLTMKKSGAIPIIAPTQAVSGTYWSLVGGCDLQIRFNQSLDKNSLICYPYNWKITPTANPGNVVSSGIGNRPDEYQYSGTLSWGESYTLTCTDNDGTTWTHSFKYEQSGLRQSFNYYKTNYSCINNNKNNDEIYLYTTDASPIIPGTIIEMTTCPSRTQASIKGPHVIPAGYNSNRYYPFHKDFSNSNPFISSALPGRYIFTITNPCTGVQSTVGPIDIYWYDVSDFSYTTQRVCGGLEVTPSGTITRYGEGFPTYIYPSTEIIYRLTNQYNSAQIGDWKNAGTPLLIPSPGNYYVCISTLDGRCDVERLPIVYTDEGMTLENYSAYVCVGETSPGHIRVSAANGVSPYTYEIIGSGLPPNTTGVFTYGSANQVCTIKITNGCPEGTQATFYQDITILDLNTATIITAPKTNLCAGEEIIINCLTLGNTTYQWTLPNGGIVDTQNLRIPNATLAHSGTYTVRVRPELCGQDLIKSIDITVKEDATASDITANNVPICSGKSATLSATAPGVTNPIYRWYDASGLLKHTGPSYTTEPLTVATTYYISVEGDNYCENATGARKEVMVTIKANATAANIEAAGTTICSGKSATLSATAPGVTNPIYRWYDASGLLKHTGPSYTTEPLTVATTYYISVEGDNYCENATGARKEVMVTIKANATAANIEAAGTTICSGKSATLSATASGVTNPIYRWYDASGLLKHTGPSYTTEPLTVATTYYISVEGDNYCENATGARKEVMVTLSSPSVGGSIAGVLPICSGSDAGVLILSGHTGNVTKWQKSTDNGANWTDISETATTLSPGTLTQTSQYRAVVQRGTCPAATSTAATITVKDCRTTSDCFSTGRLLFKEDFGSGAGYSQTPLPEGLTTYQFRNEGLDGHYAISEYTVSLSRYWYTGIYFDHTGDEYGRSMIVNADFKPGQFYELEINDLCANTKLYFSAWVFNLINPNGWAFKPISEGGDGLDINNFADPNLTFILTDKVSGSTLTTYTTGPVAKVNMSAGEKNWRQYGFEFTTANSDAVVLTIINNQLGGNGNDLVLDDIEVRICVPPIEGLQNTTVCTGESYTMEATIANDGSFGNAADVRANIEYKATETDSWTKKAQLTPSVSTDGSSLVIDYSIPSVTASNNGYYRVVVSNATNIDTDNVCRSISDSIWVAVSPTSVGGSIAGSASICSGSAAGNLVLSGYTGNITKWQKSTDNGANWTDIRETATTLSPGTLTQTTQYRAVVQSGACPAATSTVATITVKANATAANIEADGTTICSGKSATLSATAPGVTNPIYRWYDASGLLKHTGPSYTTEPLTVATTYYISVEGDNYCENATGARKAVTVTVTTSAIPTITISVNPGSTVCNGTEVMFSTIVNNEGSAPQYQWNKNGVAINGATNDSYSYTPANGDIITCTLTSNLDCVTLSTVTSAGITMTVKANATAANIEADGTTICSGQSATLSATAANVTNPTYHWYENQTATTSIHTGSIYTTEPLTATTTYYVSIEGDNYCENATGARKAVTVTVTTSAIPTITISVNPGSTVCNGTEVMFSTIVNNEGSAPQYQWNKNGVAIDGATNDSYSYTPADGDIITCTLTSNLDCVTLSTVTSAGITMTVKANATAANIEADGTTICSGQSATLSATAANVTNPTYHWYESQTATTSIHTGSIYTTEPLTATTTYYVSVEGDNYCENATGARKAVTVTVTTSAIPTITISANPGSTVCNGTEVMFSTIVNNEGSAPQYQWNKNGLAINGATNDSYLYTPADGDVITCMLTSNLDCVTSSTVTSAGITMTVKANATAANIEADGTTICSGESATLSATAANVTNPTYHWYESQTATTSIHTGSIYTTEPLTATTTYYVSVEGDNYCENATGARKAVTVTVTTSAIPTITISVNPGSTVCNGTEVMFSTIVNNEGSAPQYQWNKNGVAIDGATNDSYSYTPADGDIITCTLTSNLDCVTLSTVTSAGITMTVKANATAANIEADGTTICSGKSATLSATAANVTNPTYHWYESQTATTSIHTGSIYTTEPLTATTTYYVSVEGDNYCENATGARKAVTVTVTTSAIPTITISANPGATVCNGTEVMFSTIVNNEGSAPQYQWNKNGLAINGATNDSYSYTPANGDIITCTLTSNLDCVTSSTVTSAGITITVKANATAANIEADGTTICSGESATLSATAANVTNPTYHWYESQTATTSIHTGSIYTTEPLTAATTYYVSVEGDNYCENATGARKAVTVTVTTSAIPTITISANPGATVCNGTEVMFSTIVNNEGSAPQYQWNKNGVAINGATNDSYSYTPADGDIITCTLTSNLDCVTSPTVTSAGITMTVKANATAANIEADGTTICSGQSATLSATAANVTNPTYHWYENQTATTSIHTGSIYTTEPLTATTTYYVSVEGDNYCENATGARKAVTVTVTTSAIPTITISANPGSTVCNGTEVMFSTIVNNEGSAPQYQWNKNGVAINGATNDSYSYTPADGDIITCTLTSNLDCVTLSTVTSAGITMTVKANATAANIEADGTTICSGESATLSATAANVTNPTYHWYENQTATTSIHTGSIYTTEPLTATTTYYVSVEGDNYCENATGARKEVMVTIKANATAANIEADGTTICSGQSATLSATAANVTNPIYRWYDASGLLKHTGPSYTTDPLTATTTYYVSVEGDNYCENATGARKEVVVTVKETATAGDITLNGATICSGQTATLTPTTSVVNPTFNWYKDAALTQKFHTGSSYTTSVLIADTTFYVTVQGDEVCENTAGTGKQVAVAVRPYATASDITLDDITICSGQKATLTPETSVSNPTFNWYKDAALTALFHTGNSYTTSALTADTTFYVTVQGDEVCENAANNAKSVTVQISAIPAPPRVTTPQTFCEGATVAHLQAQGINIKWYEMVNNVYVLRPAGFALENDHIYYAVQSLGDCESTYSPVKVIIDNNAFLDAPTLPGIFDICGTGSTLADIPTYGNTNIVWYDAFTGGTKYNDPATVILENGQSYFAAQSGGGSCVSASRTEVIVTIDDITPVAPVMESPQQFCEGALVGNLAVPNNQIVWYSAAEGGEILPLTMPLIDGGVYYAAQKAGDCESATRIAVTVELTQYLKPDAMGLICINGMQKLADLPITGAGIVWYATEDSETPLPLSTAISAGATYWAAQTSGDCESERIAVTLTDDCYNPRGTIFPFVHIGDNDFDNQFITTVKLYSLPPESTLNKISYVRSKSLKLFETLVTYYDETTYIAGTPKYPGMIGFFDNPGNPILWSAINQSGATPNNTVVTDVNDRPMSSIGQFGFENVAPGQYVIEVARQGFLTRYGVVTVGADQYLGHREILGGDINADLNINDKDLSVIVSKYSTYKQPNYKWEYDIDGSSKVGSDDASIIKIYLGAYGGTIYEETYKFLRNDY